MRPLEVQKILDWELGTPKHLIELTNLDKALYALADIFTSEEAQHVYSDLFKKARTPIASRILKMIYGLEVKIYRKYPKQLGKLHSIVCTAYMDNYAGTAPGTIPSAIHHIEALVFIAKRDPESEKYKRNLRNMAKELKRLKERLLSYFP